MDRRENGDREFGWRRWTLVGCVAWVILMLALGIPILLLVTPAAGPIIGWLVGGVFYLVSGPLTGR